MLLFLLLLLPLSLLLYFFWMGQKKDVIAVFSGIISSVLVCAIKVFFTYSHRIVPFTFSENFIFYLCRLSCVPVIIVYAVFFLIVKDSIEYKIKTFFPLIIGFYMVYLPYSILSLSSSIYAGYEIFIKPIVYLAMICMGAFGINYFYKGIVQKKYLLSAAGACFFVVYLMIPAVTDALYAINYSYPLIILWDSIYIAIPLVFVLFFFIKSFFTKEEK